MIEHAWSDHSLAILQDRLRRTSPAVSCAVRRCRNCDAPRKRRTSGHGFQGGCGYCRACLERWNDADRPATGPPDPMAPADRNAPARERLKAEREARIAEFARLVARRFPIPVAARRVGVAAETGYAYSAELKRRQEASAA